ncbi:MAG TPA: glycosyltransferase family 1 protein, partial [Actinomycetota bacterium]|nr:glycosyltransferase family 1 protein [Actinomycetota bacterium]
VDQLWFSAPGGIGTYVRELAPALIEQDPTLQLLPFRSRFASGGPQESWLEGLPPVTIVDRPIRLLYPRWNLTRRPALPAPLAGADIVHATNPAAIAPLRRGQRLVVTVHDLAFLRHPELFPRAWRALYRAGLRATARHADAVLTPSTFTAEELRARSGVDASRVHVTPLASAPPLPARAIDLDATLERLGVPRPYILSVGTLEPRKNHARLIRAYRKVVDDGHPHALVLSGSQGWLDDELRRELDAPGPGMVIRTHAHAASDLDALYLGADVFAYPALYEGFGLPVLEAMARGIPTVAADGSSIPEVAGDAALLVDPLDERAIADAIARVLDDPPLAERLRLRGLDRASAFSWRETAQATLRVYRHVVGAR